MIKLVKNSHSAAIHLPPAKHMPEVTLFPGVTPVGETRWAAALENMTVRRWLKAGVLVVIDPDKIEEPAAPTVPQADDKEAPKALRTVGGGELTPQPLPPLPSKGGKK